ncbi:MAG: PilT/PilU family type 4a pilus ATPase [Clostridiales bacterium]|nr:PilT/PilU family type 4a pilus ATPase [Clostridiales bacterium]
MKKIEELIAYGRKHDCSDIHLTYGLEPVVRCHGNLVPLQGYGVMDDDMLEELLGEILEKGNGRPGGGRERIDTDLTYETKEGSRNRIHIYRQQGHPALAIRLLSMHVPTFSELSLPPVFEDILSLQQGLVLITGSAGSGKSTTLAACIEEMNCRQSKHIVTIEDPIEYCYSSKKSIVNQREVGVDTEDFATALRSALREDSDIVFVGELKDEETVREAVHAAETGRLVFSALHVTGVQSAIRHLIGIFPEQQQQQMKRRISSTLRAVVSQQLVPTEDGMGRKAEYEVLLRKEDGTQVTYPEQR